MAPALLTPAEVAERLRLSERGVRQLAYERKLGCVRIGKLYRFTEQQVEQFIRSREQTTLRLSRAA